MSTIWDMISYQHLSHGSWPLCFLTSHLVPINIYLCSLVIFVRVLTTKVTESCSFKSWFMLGLTMRTAILGLDPPPLAAGSPLSSWIYARDSWADSDFPGTFPLAPYV
jgi:dolichyl-phosphate-mannose--protein O-mannosyl transferase